MLTVLMIEKNNNERVREDAVEVRRLWHPEENVGEGVLIRWDGGTETHFGKGSLNGIYVMNRHGATVANYVP